MTWDYRVVKDTTGYSIREVYYDHAGVPEMWTENEVSPSGETLEEFEEDMDHYINAQQQPVLYVHGDKLFA